MSDYIPTPKLPDFFAPKPMSGALTYTPTTEEVRNAVWLLKHLDTPLALPDEEGFDRWLAEVKAQAWQEGWDTKPPYQEINNPYRQGEGSGNSSSQPTAETSNLLNKRDAK